MAKKIKFPLVMKDDAEVRTMEEFKAHFDIEKAVGYFLDGKLLAWLEARYYDTEADAVRALDKNDAELRKKLCGIFGAEYDEAETPALDMEEAQERSRKLAKLRQYTSDQAILDKVDSVAFDQEDLADLLDNEVHDIYLCNNSFVIPLRVEDKEYIGIGKAEAVIKSEEWVDFAAKKIVFENVEFDAVYAKKGIAAKTDALLEKGLEAKKANDNATAFSYYMQAAEAGNADGMYHVAYAYVWGIGAEKDAEKAQEWMKKALDQGNTSAMVLQGNCYFFGEAGFGKNFDLGMEWYKKAADKGDTEAMRCLGKRYQFDDTPQNIRNIHTAIMWLEKAANLGNVEAMNDLGFIYDMGSVNELGESDYVKKYQWYKKAADQGSAAAMHEVGSCYLLGEGVERDYDKALEWYHKAVDAGNNSYAMIGQVWKSKSNLLEAKKWIQKAIEYDEKKGGDAELYKTWLREIEEEIGI